MVKKVVDSRIPTLINNSVISNHRSFFVIVGDHGKDQVICIPRSTKPLSNGVAWLKGGQLACDVIQCQGDFQAQCAMVL
jgi:hypothetical protein